MVEGGCTLIIYHTATVFTHGRRGCTSINTTQLLSLLMVEGGSVHQLYTKQLMSLLMVEWSVHQLYMVEGGSVNQLYTAQLLSLLMVEGGYT